MQQNTVCTLPLEHFIVMASIGAQADMGTDAPEWVNADQLMNQTEGWEETLKHLLAVMQQQGPFDGIMGFSQVSVTNGGSQAAR